MAWHKVLVSSSTASWWLVCHRLSSRSDWLIGHTFSVRRHLAVGQPPLSSRRDSTNPTKLKHLPRAQTTGPGKCVFDRWFETRWWQETPLKGSGNRTLTRTTAASLFASNILVRRNWFMLPRASSPWEAIQNSTFVPLIISQLSMSEMRHEAFPSWFVCFWQNKPLNVCMKALCGCSWRKHLSSS